MSIFDVQHQPRAHRILQRALACDRMPHAYLFSGPEGVGKEMLAIRLAKLILCGRRVRRAWPENLVVNAATPDALDACDACDDCRMVNAGTHPDLMLVYRQLNRQHPDSIIRKQTALFLSVDVIRHFLVDRANLSPSRGRGKVFIVREAERMNDAAQNSLLKTLEEPPPATFLILLTDAMDRMLPTTRSRSQQVGFQALPSPFVMESLKRLRPDRDEAEIAYIGRHADGRLGEALRQIDDGLYGLKRTWGGQLAALTEHKPSQSPHALTKPFMADAKTLAECLAERDPDVSDTDATRAGLLALLSSLAAFYTDALRVRTGAGLAPANTDQIEVIERLAATHSERTLCRSLRHLADAETHLSRNAHIEMTLDSLFIRLARCSRPRAA